MNKMYKLKYLKVISFEETDNTDRNIIKFCRDNGLESDGVKDGGLWVVHQKSLECFLLEFGVKYFLTENMLVPVLEVACCEPTE